MADSDSRHHRSEGDCEADRGEDEVLRIDRARSTVDAQFLDILSSARCGSDGEAVRHTDVRPSNPEFQLARVVSVTSVSTVVSLVPSPLETMPVELTTTWSFLSIVAVIA